MKVLWQSTDGIFAEQWREILASHDLPVLPGLDRI